MDRKRTAEELRRLGERRMNTAIVSVAVLYALVVVAVIAAAVVLVVYLIDAVL